MGKDFDSFPFPPAAGVAPVVVHDIDSLSIPSNAKDKRGALRYLSTVVGQEAQRRFARGLAALPARSDVLDERVDHLPASLVKIYRESRAPHVTALLAPALFGEWTEQLQLMMTSGSSAGARRWLATRYDDFAP